MATESALGDNLARIRVSKGFTQEELEERSGVSVSTIRKLEQNDRKSTRVSTLRKLAQALDVRTSELFRPSPEPVSPQDESVHADLFALRRTLQPIRGLTGVHIPDLDGPVTYETVRGSFLAANGLYREDDYRAVVQTIPSLLLEAMTLVAEANDAPSERAARTLLSQTFQFSAQALIQLQQYDLAYQAITEGIAHAELADDALLAAWHVFNECWLFLREGRLEDSRRAALTTAQAIEPRFSTGNPAEFATWGWLLLWASAAAVRNNQGDEADDMLTLAQAGAHRISEQELQAPPLWAARGASTFAGFSPELIQIKAVEYAVVRGDHSRALEIHNTVRLSNRLSSSTKHRYMLDVASANASARNAAESWAILHDLRTRVPHWLKYQSFARRVVDQLIEDRSRALRADQAEIATFLGVES
ncbi:helix-turn-helix transcriptional regulator [Nonomuraea sp. NPDC050680]|uniref:helix-turn-helix domain-containing protein n=1 Tax=Nonomuraea sp. NPDC050680 TaxID=3154630 RepID=UPI0033ECCCC7